MHLSLRPKLEAGVGTFIQPPSLTLHSQLMSKIYQSVVPGFPRVWIASLHGALTHVLVKVMS